MGILPFEDEKEIMQLPMQEAFDYLVQMTMEGKRDIKKAYEQARFGVKVPFDIYDAFYQNIKEKIKSREITIGNEIICDLSEFYTEMEQRQAIIKEALINSIDSEGVMERRE